MNKGKAYRMMAWAAALVVLGISSCGKNEVLGGGDSTILVAFDAVPEGDATTKADGTYVAPGNHYLPDNSSFGVFAFYQEAVGGNDPATWAYTPRTPNFMFNQPVDFDGEHYSYSPLRYWPSGTSNTISFWAYYPHDANHLPYAENLAFVESNGSTPYNASSTGLPQATYTIVSRTAPDFQQDLMFSNLVVNKTYNNCTPVHGTVPLTFNHALALVEFRLQALGTVSSFSVSNLYWSGTCQDPTNISWTSLGDLNSLSMSPVSWSTTQPKTLTCILMPQTLRGDATLNITATGISDPNVAISGAGGISQWLPGKHYVYYISAGVIVNVITTEWEEVPAETPGVQIQ